MKLLNKIYQFILPGIFPFTICLLLLIFILFYRIFNFPTPFELSLIIEQWFNEYGWWLLFVAAFIEGFFILGIYFPGSFVIVLSVFTFGKTSLDLLYIGSISFIAFLLANICNYFLGKFGYYKFLLLIGKKNTIDNMQYTMNKYGNRTFLLTGFFPNFIAIASVCAGIANINFIRTVYLLILSLTFWVTVWTLFGSLIINKVDLQDSNQSFYLLTLIFLWGVFLITKEKIYTQKKAK